MRVRGKNCTAASRCLSWIAVTELGYLVWATRLNSTPMPADFCIQPVMFVSVVVIRVKKNRVSIPSVTFGVKLDVFSYSTEKIWYKHWYLHKVTGVVKDYLLISLLLRWQITMIMGTWQLFSPFVLLLFPPSSFIPLTSKRLIARINLWWLGCATVTHPFVFALKRNSLNEYSTLFDTFR